MRNSLMIDRDRQIPVCYRPLDRYEACYRDCVIDGDPHHLTGRV